LAALLLTHCKATLAEDVAGGHNFTYGILVQKGCDFEQDAKFQKQDLGALCTYVTEFRFHK
jgi:hypothetical protein